MKKLFAILAVFAMALCFGNVAMAEDNDSVVVDLSMPVVLTLEIVEESVIFEIAEGQTGVETMPITVNLLSNVPNTQLFASGYNGATGDLWETLIAAGGVQLQIMSGGDGIGAFLETAVVITTNAECDASADTLMNGSTSALLDHTLAINIGIDAAKWGTAASPGDSIQGGIELCLLVVI